MEEKDWVELNFHEKLNIVYEKIRLNIHLKPNEKTFLLGILESKK